jgi:hypothetical protein
VFVTHNPTYATSHRTSCFASMSAQMLASSVAASAVAPRFGKKASGVSARKAISSVPVRAARVQVRNTNHNRFPPDCNSPARFG